MDYIVLGQIPGTSLQLGFLGYLALFDICLATYYLKKYRPQTLKNAQKLGKKLKIYTKRAGKRLSHIRDDVLGPKLKFLK